MCPGGSLRSHRPARSEAQLEVPRTQTSEEPVPSRRGCGKWVDPGYTAPECALEMNLPASSPHSTFTIPRGDRGTAALPLDLLCLLFLQHGDRLRGGGWGGRDSCSSPPPALSIRSRRQSPSWVPSLQPFSGQNGEDNRTGKSRKGMSFN